MEPDLEKVQCEVKGMSCSSCAMTVSGYLEKKGMQDVVVSLATGEVSFRAGEGTDVGSILEGIDKLGYEVVRPGPGKGRLQTVLGDIRFWLAGCALFTIALLGSMWIPGFGSPPWLQCLLATPVWLAGIWHFGRSALAALRQGIANMDVLITTGSTAAYGYSLYGLLKGLGPDYLFFDTAAAIITIVLLGNLLEQGAVRQTAAAITELAGMQPARARRVLTSGRTEEVDSRDLVPGDLVLAREGERIPADGKVESGNAILDESMITGESIPVGRAPGEMVIGGTLLSQGNIRVRITATGAATVLSGIVRMVREAQQQHTPLQRLADRISGIFVPGVLLAAALFLAISTGIFHLSFSTALLRSIAMVVIACPCAMGIATPAAVMTGLGRAARNGILIRGADTLEGFGKIGTVIFDKTGTLTTGRLRIRAFSCTLLPEQQFQSLVATLEEHSSHPIAKSITRQWTPDGAFNNLSITEVRGSGIRGTGPEGKEYLLGSASFASAPDEGTEHDLYLSVNGAPAGWIDLVDEMRPGVTETMAYLSKNRIRTILVSGDRKDKCERLALDAGIGEVFSRQSPGDKMNILKKLVASGSVAMVGDGINDAPALTLATVGISLSDASAVARQTASVVLMDNQVSLLPLTLEIGKKTVATIRQNLFWAFIYNLLAIPLAAAGFLHPMIGAAAMGLSDLFLVGNSLRLRYRKLL